MGKELRESRLFASSGNSLTINLHISVEIHHYAGRTDGRTFWQRDVPRMGTLAVGRTI